MNKRYKIYAFITLDGMLKARYKLKEERIKRIKDVRISGFRKDSVLVLDFLCK